MTTLHVRGDQLRSVVEPYPVVKDLRVSTDFPHGLRITVVENTPVAVVTVDGAKTPVAADGTLLRGADQRDLPVVPLRAAPGGDRVADQTARDAIAALAAAPPALRAACRPRLDDRAQGLTITLQQRPRAALRRRRPPAAKWAAAAAVLADPDSARRHLPRRSLSRAARGGRSRRPRAAARSGVGRRRGSRRHDDHAGHPGGHDAVTNLNLSLRLRIAVSLEDNFRLPQSASKIALYTLR